MKNMKDEQWSLIAYKEGRKAARGAIRKLRGDRREVAARLMLWWDAQANPKTAEFSAGMVDEFSSHLMLLQREWEWVP